jgi:predicted NAD/FAD-dependent oxidoreductase
MDIQNTVSLISFAVAVIGAVLGWLGRKAAKNSTVAKHLQTWRARLTDKRLIGWIEEAEKFSAMSNTEKRAFVVAKAQDWCEDHLGTSLPDSIAGWLVETAFQNWKLLLAKAEAVCK